MRNENQQNMNQNGGQFIPYFLNHKKLSNKEQAKMILDRVRALKKQYPGKKVGITYSANEDQTIKIAETYGNGGYNTGTTGANQAEVIAEIEKLLRTDDYKDCQNTFRIIPVTTILRKTKDNEARINLDLTNAEKFLSDGNIVLGWVNAYGLNNKSNSAVSDNIVGGLYLSPNKVKEYAIGGGIAKLPDVLSSRVQNTFQSFAAEYPADLSNENATFMILYLKHLYRHHGGSDKRAAEIFDKPIADGNAPDLDTIKERLKAREKTHTGFFGTGIGKRIGASEKTLQEIDVLEKKFPQEASDKISGNAEQRLE